MFKGKVWIDRVIRLDKCFFLLETAEIVPMGSILSYLIAYIIGGVTFVPLVVYFIWRLSPIVPDDVNERIHLDNVANKEICKKKGEPAGYRDLRAGQIIDNSDLGLKTFTSGWLTVTKEFYKFPQINPDDFKSSTSNSDVSSSGAGNDTKSESNTNSTNDYTGDSVSHSNTSGNIFSKFIKGSNANNANTSEGELKDSDAESDVGATKLKQLRRKYRFYGVIKHGNLFLYTDETQKNVKHAIVLDHYMVALWPRNLTDGQLFTKRSAICLLKKDAFIESEEKMDDLLNFLRNEKSSIKELPKSSYFLYGDTSLEKENWYYSLLRATSLPSDNPHVNKINPLINAKPLYYHTANMLDLIETLNSTENQLTTQWINALLGRLFLATYQTDEFKTAFRNRIEDKLRKIRTPGFLDQLQIHRIDVGNSAPFLTNPKLKSLSPNGDLEITVNMLYKGKAMVEIATKLFINIGVGFKQRQFDIVMKVILNKIEGELLIKLKPQPSSRIWYTYTKMPDIDLTIEPVFSSRNISYGIVTSLLESRFKDAIKTSLVYPFFDDFVFYKSPSELFRGGIFDKSVRKTTTENPNFNSEAEIKTKENKEDPENEITVNLKDNTSLNQEIIKDSNDSVFSKASTAISVEREGEHTLSRLNTIKSDNSGSIEIKTSTDTVSEQQTNADIKHTMMKSYSKLKTWYKKNPQSNLSTPINTTFESSSLKRGESNGSTSNKELPYTPPEMISNRRRKTSRAENPNALPEAKPELDIPAAALFQTSNSASTPSNSSFQLVSSNIKTRPSAEALASFERKRGGSKSSQFSSISSLDDKPPLFQHNIPNSPSSPDQFINEKFKSQSTSNPGSGLFDNHQNLNNNIIAPKIFRFDSHDHIFNDNVADTPKLQDAPVLSHNINDLPKDNNLDNVIDYQKTRLNRKPPPLPLPKDDVDEDINTFDG